MSAKKNNVIDSIWRMKRAGLFGAYIDEIAFPHFRNLERDLTITFDFPVTALIGQNGINKSSILRALQACPDQNSISDYWFDTDLDYIENEPNDRQRYIHRYRVPSSGHIAEVIKIRIQKQSRGKDYFETAKPRKSDGMKDMPEMDDRDKPYRVNTRWKPIKKDVVYLDFRAQLPAFDIFMNYQHRLDKRDAARRKSLVRLRAKRLNQAISDSKTSSTICGSERLLSTVVSLNHDELDDVTKILGREYKSIKMLKHDLYDFEGWTAKLETKDFDYSEAFAGSGEFAAIMVVHSLHCAAERSLILLDEPETSLHPGAQTALCSFLLEMTKKKHFQIVMATHSRDIIQSLPPEGRKLLGILPHGSKVSLLSPRASLDEAFSRLGANFSHNSIYVEDELAAEILRCAFRKYSTDETGSVEILPFPGGADTILTRLIPSLATIDSNALIVLDGDRRTDEKNEDFPGDADGYEKALEKYGIKRKFIPMNGGNDTDESHRSNQLKKTLLWVRKHVFYLPGSDPEGLALSIVKDIPLELNANNSAKNKEAWKNEAEKEYFKAPKEQITAEEILNLQKLKLAQAVNEAENEAASNILNELEPIIHSALQIGSIDRQNAL